MRSAGFGSSGFVAGLLVLALCGNARSQGEGHEHHGIANNTCPLIVAGMHEMHVAAYHATTGMLDELCREIPSTGKISITLDAIDNAIREMTTEIKVVAGDGTAPDPVVLKHVPETHYPSGVASFTVDLESPGKYALLVTLRQGAMEMSGKHVLTVAHPLAKWLYAPIGAAIVLVGAAAAYFWSERRKKLVPKNG